MELISNLFNGIWFIFFVIGIMMLTNLVNAKGYFVPFYRLLESKIKSKRLLVTLVSAVSGILPVPGRTIISAGALDTLAPDDNRRQNYGIINYLSTHHYYLWSPLEATVLIPISVFGISYLKFLTLVAPLLLTLITITLYYIFYVLKESDIEVEKIQHIKREYHPFKGTKWDVVLFVGIVIIASNILKYFSEDIVNFFMNYNTSLFIGSIIAFATSFILGSSSKFAGVTTALASVFGITYLPLFFALGYSGYLISPTHKCLIITKTYFNVSTRMYRVLLMISAALITIGYLSI